MSLLPLGIGQGGACRLACQLWKKQFFAKDLGAGGEGMASKRP